MEFLTGALFGSQLIFFAALLIVLLTLFFSEVQAAGQVSFVAFLIFISVMYFWGETKLSDFVTWSNIGLYFLTGFIFSLVRTFGKRFELTRYERERFALQDHVVRWVLQWPISLLYWIFGRLLSDLVKWIYSLMSVVYEYLLFGSAKK